MALSDADKQARYRAHKADNHALCAADRECRTGKPRRRVRSAPALDESVGPGRGAPLPPGTRTPGTTRSDRSRELWDELAPQLSSPYRVMLSEAVRIADRLDRLDSIIDGNDEWLRITTEQGTIVVAVDASLAEARQQATTLKALLAEIIKGLPAQKPVTQNVRGGGIASLADAAARRRAAAR